jgi:hypothetical protein
MKDVNGLLFECIDEILAGLLGLKARSSVYLTILTKFSVTREDLPDHLNGLVSVLAEDFGPGPAKNVSRAIAKRFYSELGLDFGEDQDLNLLSYVQDAKRIHSQTVAKTRAEGARLV